MKSYFCGFQLAVIISALGTVTHAADLTGIGYIDLTGSAAVPATSTALGKRFVWTPNYNSLYVGYMSSGQSFTSNSVSLFGSASAQAVSIGQDSTAGVYATALGLSSNAAANSISIGHNSASLAEHAIAIGSELENYDGEEHTYFYPTEAIGSSSVAIGVGATSSGLGSLALGTASSSGSGAVALIGNASGNSSVAIRGTTLGDFAAAFSGGFAGADYAFAGPLAQAYAKFSVVFGSSADSRHRKDNSLIDPVIASSGDPVFIVGNGPLPGGYVPPNAYSNAFTIYRDGSARFNGEIQMKAGSGYLTIQSSGTTNRTLTLPDTNGALLANTSALDASKLTGEVPAANLPASVGATVELDGDEVVGVLPWSKVGTVGRPTTVDGYGITNAVKVDSQGYVVGTLRVQQAGDIQMFSP